ncbi:MAG: hypothetical protein LBE17_13140 [Treponema sp.]|nr:hypothetical protein [Treponema sp.]
MDFLLAHWHCIVPVVGIAAVLLLRGFGGNIEGTEMRRRQKPSAET